MTIESILYNGFFGKCNSLVDNEIILKNSEKLLKNIIKNEEQLDILDEVKTLKGFKVLIEKEKQKYRYTCPNNIGRVYHNTSILFVPKRIMNTLLVK